MSDENSWDANALNSLVEGKKPKKKIFGNNDKEVDTLRQSATPKDSGSGSGSKPKSDTDRAADGAFSKAAEAYGKEHDTLDSSARLARKNERYERLCKAASNGDLPLLSALILAGASIEGPGPILFHAVKSGSFALVKFLLNNGANPNAIDRK